MAKLRKALAVGGALGLELQEPTKSTSTWVAPDRVVPLSLASRTFRVSPVPPCDGTGGETPEPSPESLIQVTLDQKACKWRVEVIVLAPGGELLAQSEEAGHVLLRTCEGDDPAQEMLGLGDYDLLGIALDRGFAVLSGMSLPLKCTTVVEADTRVNGILKVSLVDWIRTGAFTPGVRRRFPYAQEAWARLAGVLGPQDAGQGVIIRWKR